MADQKTLTASLQANLAQWRGLHAKLTALSEADKALELEEQGLLQNAAFDDDKAVARIGAIRVKRQLVEPEGSRLQAAIAKARQPLNDSVCALAAFLAEKADRAQRDAFEKAVRTITPLCLGDVDQARVAAAFVTTTTRPAQWHREFASVQSECSAEHPRAEMLLAHMAAFDRGEALPA